MKQFFSHGKSRTDFRTLAEWLKDLEPFTNASETFRGESDPHITVYGWLDQYPEDLAFIKESHYNGMVDYVVWSYHTPIVWHHKALGWIDPGHGYSQTTKAKHYRPAIVALSVLD